MPIVAHSSLPTFEDLRRAGEPILALDEAIHQDIRELHIGLLNMMPDAALRVTEQQYLRLIGSANQIVQIYVHPFTVPGLARAPETQAYIDEHYESFSTLQRDGLDALIISGANVTNPSLDLEAFWDPLSHVIDWARDHVTSILCSCLATHALVQLLHGVRRRPLLSKRWGVFPHEIVNTRHPLLRDTNTRFDVPHSRWNDVGSEQLRQAGIRVLIESVDGDFHLGTSADGIRMVYLQGHPEYDTTSLLKEYKREVNRFLRGELDVVPPSPANYFVPAAARTLREYFEAALDQRTAGREPGPFPEREIVPLLDNTWTDTAKAIFNNWLGLIYRLTDVGRGVPFMAAVNPDDPLGLGDAA
ncbi:MAG: homoserine O-succinyltransferase [Nitriliruptoraceae bacterium]